MLVFLFKTLFIILSSISISNLINEINIVNHKEKYFLSIGRLSKQKNFKYLIDEFKLFKNENKNSNIKLLIIGDGEEKTKLFETINNLGIADKVLLLGFQKNIYLLQKYQIAI